MKSELKEQIYYSNYFENDYILGCHIGGYIECKILYDNITEN